jgi:glycosyltransferase involved in cell wall biosynthesis
MVKPYISVVIAARDEEELLPNAITALRCQDIRGDQFELEIIVVDNCSTDRTSEVARECGADKVIYEPVLGTNIARETGRLAAQGQIIVCLDADCVPPPSWLRHISCALSQDGVAAVSGPYDYGFRGFTKLADILYSHWLFSYADRILAFVFWKPFGVIRAGNFAAWRSTLEIIGGFPPFTFWGDDTALGLAIARKVGRVWYHRKLIIESSPRRFEQYGLVRTTMRYLYHFFRVYLFEPAPQ